MTQRLDDLTRWAFLEYASIENVLDGFLARFMGVVAG